MYAACVEGFDAAARRDFDAWLIGVPRELPATTAPGAPRRLRVVPDAMRAERLEAIRALGGDIVAEGA